MQANTDTPAIGAWLFPADPAGDLVDAVVALERAGFDEVWLADEGPMREPAPILGAASQRTSTIRLGVGITSAVLRHPGALASTWMTVDELSGGRAMLGLGLGGELSLAPYGLGVDRPVALLRDAVRLVKAAAAGQSGAGYVAMPHAQPARPLPVYVAAKGEQLNRMASREADGVFLSGFRLDALAAAVEWARSVRPVSVALYASVRFRDDAPHDPTALSGSVDEIAAGLAQLVAEHRPSSIGMALVDGDPVADMVANAALTATKVRSLLSARG